MARAWDADIELTLDGAAILIAEQFPSLLPIKMDALGVGWDNSAFIVNDEVVFRFPRRKLGAELIVNETRVLPLLAPELGLPIPLPRYIGQPRSGYPYPFVGYTVLHGTTACTIDWHDAGRTENAIPIARFLSRLHSIAIPDDVLTWAPRDDIRRADIRYRAPGLKQRLGLLTGHVADSDIANLIATVDHSLTASLRSDPPCWVHGDLYSRHLLMDENECLCGVIDWGDVHLGDPALDLSIVYTFLPPSCHHVFWQVYGGVDEAARLRARFRAINYGAILTAYGSDVGDASILSIGRYALQNVQQSAEEIL